MHGPPPLAGEGLALIDPERALAIAYAPRAVQPALTALFALDERFGAVVGTTSEDQIGLIRLAWWREALERLDHSSAPAEPLLTTLARELLERGITGAALAAIEDGWAALLDDATSDATLARHGDERGARLFQAAGMIVGVDDPRLAAAGRGWALADLAHRHSDPLIRQRARLLAEAAFHEIKLGRWPRRARPLAMLAILARRDVRTDRPRRQGSPGRMLRMLAIGLTGF